MDPALAWAVRVGAVLLLAAGLAFVLRRPRLDASASLRGSTASGTLYVVAHNKGHRTARGLRVEVAWRAEDGALVEAAREALDDLAAHDARTVPLSRFRPGEARAWRAIEVTLRARHALPARAVLPLQRRAAGADAAGDVQYRRVERCPASPDGGHRNEVKPLYHDGVTERWEVCQLCGHLARLPLSPAEAATQARHRAARLERERRRLEEEFRRREAEEEPPRARRARSRPEPDRDGFAAADAFRILGLDPASATWEAVVAAHRALALRFHPDRAPQADADARAALEERMQDINRARDRLREHFFK